MPSAAQREPGYYGSRGTVHRSPSGRRTLSPPLPDSPRVDGRGCYSGRHEYYQNRSCYEKPGELCNPRQPQADIQSHYLAPPLPLRRSSQKHIIRAHDQYDAQQFLPQACPADDCDRYLHLSRSASLQLRPAPPENLIPVNRPRSLSKTRKPRPTPLQIPPVVHQPQTPEENFDLSPYSPSILALYSPSQTESPNWKTRSLPTYRFQASDFLTTEFDKSMSSPWFQLSPEITSASPSVFSSVPGSASSQSSTSSFAHNLSDVNYGLLGTPEPKSVATTKRYAMIRDLVPNVSTIGEM